MNDTDAISLREVIELLWRSKWLVLGLTFGIAFAAALLTKTQPRIYKAVITISPVANTSAASRFAGGGGGDQGSQIGGIASLIGLNFGGDSSKAESLAVLQSEALTERFVKEHDLLPVLFPQYWDARNRRWLPAPPKRQPSLWKANKIFRKVCIVAEDKKTQMTTLTVSWTDPEVAASWANGLVRAANDYLRSKAINESEQHIQYLKEQAANTDVAQLRAAIYAVLESEIKNVMLAKGPGDYALKVIDPAFPPEVRSSPLLWLWALVGAFVGFILSMLILFFRRAWHVGAPK